LSSDDLLDPPTDITLELMDLTPANGVELATESGAFVTLAAEFQDFSFDEDPQGACPELEPEDWESFRAIRRRDAIRPPAPCALPEELSSAHLVEEPDLSPATSDATQEGTHPIDILETGDLEVVCERPKQSHAAQTVLFCCRPGDTLPAYAQYADELPRFATSTKRKRPGQFVPAPLDHGLSRWRPTCGLPAFSIPDSTAARRVPAVRLPSFRIEDHPAAMRPVALPPGLPKFMIDG
jgi:hypothetical protein